MDVLQYITQNYNKFTNREKLIADYLLKTKESIIGMSAKGLVAVAVWRSMFLNKRH